MSFLHHKTFLGAISLLGALLLFGCSRQDDEGPKVEKVTKSRTLSPTPPSDKRLSKPTKETRVSERSKSPAPQQPAKSPPKKLVVNRNLKPRTKSTSATNNESSTDGVGGEIKHSANVPPTTSKNGEIGSGLAEGRQEEVKEVPIVEKWNLPDMEPIPFQTEAANPNRDEAPTTTATGAIPVAQPLQQEERLTAGVLLPDELEQREVQKVVKPLELPAIATTEELQRALVGDWETNAPGQADILPGGWTSARWRFNQDGTVLVTMTYEKGGMTKAMSWVAISHDRVEFSTPPDTSIGALSSSLPGLTKPVKSIPSEITVSFERPNFTIGPYLLEPRQ